MLLKLRRKFRSRDYRQYYLNSVIEILRHHSYGLIFSKLNLTTDDVALIDVYLTVISS